MDDKPSTTHNAQYDIGVVGAGPGGMLAAIALAQTGAEVGIWDPRKSSHTTHTAPITLRPSSKTLLETLGVWDRLGNSPRRIRSLRIGHSDHFGSIRFNSQDLGVDGLAYVVNTDQLADALQKELQARAVTWHQNSIVHRVSQNSQGFHGQYQQAGHEAEMQVKRLVICDGVDSKIAESLQIEKQVSCRSFTSYIFDIQCDTWARDEAWQIFAREGVIGMIPGKNSNAGTIVVTTDGEEEVAEEAIIERLRSRVGAVQKMQFLGKQASKLQFRKTPPKKGAIILGNARLSMPPLGAQSFNTTVSEVAALMTQQARVPWQGLSGEAWQKWWVINRDKQAEDRFKLMQSLWDYQGEKDTYHSFLSRWGWAWLGLDATMQEQVFSEGQGERWEHR